MELKKVNAPTNTVTRDTSVLSADTGNIYETVRIIAKRANQVAQQTKRELEQRLQEVASYSDSMEEVHENEEQIEISRAYEQLPKATLIATKEYEEGDIRYYMPGEEAHISGQPRSVVDQQAQD
ncbi:MAG: DNA-directed RNA polymerase subunit omega [Porphyromonas sp.]|nr:DNA-directed RNA polymerase subunit omega [Porphyromonas sp.]